MNRHILLAFAFLFILSCKRKVLVPAEQALLQEESVIGMHIYSGSMKSVVRDDDGNFWIFAVTGSTEAKLVKYSPAGDELFSREYESSELVYTSRLVACGDGGVIAMASAAFENRKMECMVHKLDAVGNIVWKKYYGTPENEYPGNITRTTDGHYLITATTVPDVPGDEDCYVAKINDNGDLVWGKILETSALEWAADMVETADHNYLLTGNRLNNGATTDVGYWIILDASGNVLSDASSERPGLDRIISSIKQLPGGDLMLLGYDYNKSGFHKRGCIVRISPSGQVIWSGVYGSLIRGSEIRDVVPDNDGGFLAVGWEDTITSTTIVNTSLIFIGQDGTEKRKIILASGSNSEAVRVFKQPTGEFIIIGTRSTSTSNLEYYILGLNTKGEW